MAATTRTSVCHWGAFEASIEDGRLTGAQPLPDSGASARMIAAWPDLVYSKTRIDQPYVRASFLHDREGADGRGRGREEMVPLPWDDALALVADELTRVRARHGHDAVFGGSYGWSSAGRYHHARGQLRRFLAASGGFTNQVGNYSWGAAHAVLPHVLGDHDAVASAATSWDSIVEHTDLLVAFGGLNPKNWRVTSGGAGFHHMDRHVERAQARGTAFVVISPMADDKPETLEADWIALRPNSDTALMLALCHELLRRGRADRAFLERYCVGHERFFAYLRGETDGVAKTVAWAAALCDLPPGQIEDLAARMTTGRVMVTATWSLQRAQHGEQPFWALIALAAMLGQIGQPGGGFTFGYGSLNAVGEGARRGLVPSMEPLPNPSDSAVPVARIADMLEQPGATIDFNGRRVTYPDTRLIYWAGGNPFHHAQDLFRLQRAWARPETVIVHEPWWTATAKRADIVLPATTTAERNDIGGSSRDPHVFAMPQLIAPLAGARDDAAIFTELAERLGCAEEFTEGLDEAGWLRRLWRKTETTARAQGLTAPDFETFWREGVWHVPPPERPEVYLEDFRAAPEQAPLKTPSGRIEIASQRVQSFGYADLPGHPAWVAPDEWLGTAKAEELHLLSRQPAYRLHSQLGQTAAGGAGEPEDLWLNPADARARNLGDGSLALVENARGACRARVKVSDLCRRGVVAMATGTWFEPDGSDNRLDLSGNPNAVTRDLATSPLGQACTAMTCLVRVRPYPDPA